MEIKSYLKKLNDEGITNTKYEDLVDDSVFLTNDSLTYKKNFNFCGVYILTDTDKNEEVVYVGSAYVRTVHERLLQYTSKNDTGNTLIRDLVDSGIANNENDAMVKIEKLKVYAFKDISLEYKMIEAAGTSLANKVGNKKSK